MTYFLRTDGSSFSDPEGVPGGGPGPADDIVPAGRVYCYSSDEEDKEEAEQAVPLHQRIKRSRFVSRIQEERIHIHETARTDKLDMEQFQPMMTSETVSDPASIPRVSSLQPRVTRAKRECQAEAECYDDATRYLRKRERRERRQETGRASDYGSLSTLGSSLHKLDLIEQDPKTEVNYDFYVKIVIIKYYFFADKTPGYETVKQVTLGVSHIQEDHDSAQETDAAFGQGRLGC